MEKCSFSCCSDTIDTLNTLNKTYQDKRSRNVCAHADKSFMIRIRNRLLWIPLWEVDELQRVNATHVRKGRGSFQTLQTLESYSVYVKAVPTQSPTWHAHKLA